MNLARRLAQDLILLEMATLEVPEEEREEISPAKYLAAQKEKILEELVGLLWRSGRIASRRKLLTDLLGRERKASTGLERGVAVPHVRTAQAREFVFAFARSTPGLAFDCRDSRPAHLFFVLVAPPRDDKTYLDVFRKIALAFSGDSEAVLREFLEARDEGEVLRAMRHLDG